MHIYELVKCFQLHYLKTMEDLVSFVTLQYMGVSFAFGVIIKSRTCCQSVILKLNCRCIDIVKRLL
jgi:hypothetical protein